MPVVDGDDDGDLVAASGDDMEDSPEDRPPNLYVDLAEFCSIYYEAVFSDNFMKYLSAVNIEGDRTHVMLMISTFLKGFIATEAQEPGFTDASMVEVLEPVTRTMRGLNSVLSPVPGEYGATLADFAFVWPSGRAEQKGSLERKYKFGKSLTTELRNQGEWAKLSTVYRNACGTEAGCTEAYCRELVG